MIKSPDAPSPQAVRALLDALLPDHTLQAVRALPGNFSNATHLVDALSATGEPARLVVRRYAVFGSYDRGEKARREYGTLELLQTHGIPAPRPLYLDAEGTLLGSPGIVTTYVPGSQIIAPRNSSPCVQALAEMLARIHAIPCDAGARSFLLDANDEASWFVRSGTMSEDVRAHPDGPQVWQAVHALLPGLCPVAPTLVHIDYWMGNILWQQGAISAVLDWEEAAYGDPAIDVGYARMELCLLDLEAAAEAFLAAYEAAAGRRVENLGLRELAAAVRAMPDPAGWIPEWDVLGAHGCTATEVRQRLRQFIAGATRRARAQAQ